MSTPRRQTTLLLIPHANIGLFPGIPQMMMQIPGHLGLHVPLPRITFPRILSLFPAILPRPGEIVNLIP